MKNTNKRKIEYKAKHIPPRPCHAPIYVYNAIEIFAHLRDIFTALCSALSFLCQFSPLPNRTLQKLFLFVVLVLLADVVLVVVVVAILVFVF